MFYGVLLDFLPIPISLSGSYNIFALFILFYIVNSFQIEVLKRLQRETFSDLMKLRDRQDKVERVLSSFASSKGSPFQESSTQLKGTVNVGGALFFQNDQQAHDSLDSLGINTGIDARFIFKTNLREKDALLAELVAHQNNEFTSNSLVLSKITYQASISNLLSMILVPLGATCNDFRFDSDHSQVKFLLM